MFGLIKRRLKVKLLSSTATRRSGMKMMVVADTKTRGNGPRLQLGRFRLTTKTAFIRQHSNRCRLSTIEWTKPQLI